MFFYKIITKKILAACLLAIIFCCSGEESLDSDKLIDLSLVSENDWEMSNKVLSLINIERLNQGKTLLVKDTLYATAYAVDHSKYMIDNSNVSHDYFFERNMALKNRGASSVSENVAFGYSNPNSVVNAWLKSEPHKESIIGDYTHIGFGILKSPKNKYYYTLLLYR